jgi:hypothetical protein
LCLALLSKTQTEVSSFDEYYRVQGEALQYFNVVLELNALELTLSLLSQPDIQSKELDQLKFSDLAIVLKHGHDSLAKKLHAKLNRRLKKYLGESQRPENEK